MKPARRNSHLFSQNCLFNALFTKKYTLSNTETHWVLEINSYATMDFDLLLNMFINQLLINKLVVNSKHCYYNICCGALEISLISPK